MVGCFAFFSMMLITMVLALMVSCILMIFIATTPTVTKKFIKWSWKIANEMAKFVEEETEE